MKTVQYTVPITRTESTVEYVQAKDSRNAVLAVDTSTAFGNVKLVNSKTIAPLRYAKLYTKTPAGITIKSNSPDILITDKVSKTGEPLYYKGIIRQPEHLAAVQHNGVTLETDDHFYYSSEKLDKVTYLHWNSKEEVFDEMYPVYIAENRDDLKLVSEIDNKTYSYIFDGTEYIITCKNTEVFFKTKDKPLVTIEKYSPLNSDTIKLHTNLYSFTNGRAFISRDIVTNNITPKDEECFIYDKKIHLSNRGMNSKQFKLKLYSESGDLIQEYTNEDLRILTRHIFPQLGYIDISHYGEDFPEYGYSTIEYTYPVFLSNNISIPLYLLQKSKFISVGIKPNGKIVYYCVNYLGLIHFTNDTSYDEGISSFNIKTFSNSISLKPLDSYINGNIVQASNTPKTINDLKTLIGGDSEYIEICTLHNEKHNLNYIRNTRQSIPVTGSVSIRELHLPKVGFAKFIIGNKYTEVINSNVTEIPAGISTMGTLRMLKTNKDYSVYIFDYSNDIYNEDAEEVDDPDVLRFLHVRPPPFINKTYEKYKVIGIKNREYSDVNCELKHLEDEKSIMIKITKEELKKYDFLSVTYLDSFPTLVYKI